MSEYFGDVQGTVALVTGAASGLGKGTADRLIREGAKVVLADLPTSTGQKVADDLGANAIFAPMDVSFLYEWYLVS